MVVEARGIAIRRPSANHPVRNRHALARWTVARLDRELLPHAYPLWKRRDLHVVDRVIVRQIVAPVIGTEEIRAGKGSVPALHGENADPDSNMHPLATRLMAC